jgi:hypothetical protein
MLRARLHLVGDIAKSRIRPQARPAGVPFVAHHLRRYMHYIARKRGRLRCTCEILVAARAQVFPAGLASCGRAPPAVHDSSNDR